MILMDSNLVYIKPTGDASAPPRLIRCAYVNMVVTLLGVLQFILLYVGMSSC